MKRWPFWLSQVPHLETCGHGVTVETWRSVGRTLFVSKSRLPRLPHVQTALALGVCLKLTDAERHGASTGGGSQGAAGPCSGRGRRGQAF